MAAGSIVAAGAGAAAAHGAGASGAAVGSPGLVSGNVIQIPVDVPINLCGNTIDIIGLLNPTFGNFCLNAEGGHHGGHHGGSKAH
ncbi:chaplin [Streptomyces sp. YIM 98790]|uniref:chaplin n=1 Tax=Streptomyces sp. YIM 98790 TaxID=2689077 RepID=UPI00140981EC|nr:chaplin [Streptomyces sp. YIM 98790]